MKWLLMLAIARVFGLLTGGRSRSPFAFGDDGPSASG
jgi:hypothetical protein